MHSIGRATIRTRLTASKQPRYQVRYRYGGGNPRHGGSFTQKKLAVARMDFINMELAAGRDPMQSLEELQRERVERKPLSEWAVDYRKSRAKKLAPGSLVVTDYAIRHIEDRFGKRDPHTITYYEVQEWVNELKLAPATVRGYFTTLSLLLRFAGCKPNPARDERMNLPSIPRKVIDPPTASEVAAIISASPEAVRLPLRILAETGMRAGEIRSLEWQDVDFRRSMFRLRDGKTNAARRWVKVPRDLMDEVQGLATGDNASQVGALAEGGGTRYQGYGGKTAPSPSASARIFPLNPNTLRNTMADTCRALGMRQISPHKLRHRYGSVEVAQGTPLPLVAQQMGHANPTTTLGMYAWAMVGEPLAKEPFIGPLDELHTVAKELGIDLTPTSLRARAMVDDADA